MAAASSILLGVAAGASLASAYQQSEAMKLQADFQKSQAEVNSQLAEIDVKNAEERGKQAQVQHGQKAKQLFAQQRLGLADQGLDLSSGSALGLQQQAREMSAKDQMTIKNNAWLEAWGIKTQAATSLSQANIGYRGAQVASGATLLTGFGQAASYASQYKGRGPKRATSTEMETSQPMTGGSYNNYDNYA